MDKTTIYTNFMALKRDSGRFTQKFDEPIDPKAIGIRLFKKDRAKIDAIANDKNIAPGQLIRNIVRQWLKENND